MSRELRIQIDETIDEKIPVVKNHYGLKNDSELVRLLISEKFNEITEKEQLPKKEPSEPQEAVNCQ